MAKKSSAKKSVTPKKTAAKKQSKPQAKKAVAMKASAKKVAAKSVAKKAPVKKAAAKTAPKKSITKKATVKKAVAKKVAVAKAPAKKLVATKATAKTIVQKAPPAGKTAKKLDLSHFVTPLDDRLIVQIIVGPKMTSGGLYIPDTVEATGNREATVVAVGRGHLGPKGRIHPMDVQVGDKILFPEHAGSKIQIQNEELVILREAEVMGVVSK